MAATPAIVIVGAGQAGSQIAASLRSGGYAGAIQLVGDEAALPYQRPPLSKAFLKRQADATTVQLRPSSFYESQAIECIGGDPAVSIDREQGHVVLKSGRILPFDGLAIATGSRPRALQAEGADLAGVLSLRSVADAERLRDQLEAAHAVVIVGGGFIGLEVAACAAALGKKVTVLEAADRLMARAVAPLTSDFFLRHHVSLGVRVELGAAVSALGGDRRVTHVHLGNGEQVPADLVLVGVGATVNDELAAAAGLVCDRGIVVDEFARTSDPRIVAAGDCTVQRSPFAPSPMRLESVQNAIDQAKVAAATLLGTLNPHDSVPWFWSDQADVKLQTTGLSFGADAFVLRGALEARKFTVFHLRDGLLVAADSVNAPVDHMVSRQLVARRTRPDPAVLADTNKSLKELLATPGESSSH